jgi:hypothetical protein
MSYRYCASLCFCSLILLSGKTANINLVVFGLGSIPRSAVLEAYIRGVATLDSSRHVPIHKFANFFFYKSMLHFPTRIRM